MLTDIAKWFGRASILLVPLLFLMGAGTFDPSNKSPNIGLTGSNLIATDVGSNPGSTAFTPLHTYYMAASGCNDSNNGTSTSTPWCTPNHSLVCGDVILANSGTYNGDFSNWGTVSSCPSTSAGIDGTGGINVAVLLCAGSDIESCKVDCATGACNGGNVGAGGRGANSAVMNVNKNFWAISGWAGTASGPGARGFQMDACLTTSTIIHHIAFINSKIVNADDGWDTDDCGYGHAVPGNGVDYAAAVGLIVQNAAQDQICVAAVDFVGPASIDANSGTHTYIRGNFIWNSQSTNCINVSDSEAIMLDTIDAHAYSGKIVIADNLIWMSMRNCIQVFYQQAAANTPIVNIYNNTCYADLTNTGSADFADGEINLNTTGSSPAPQFVVTLQNNIAVTNRTTSGTFPSTIYGLLVGGALWNLTDGGIGNENIILSPGQTSCVGASCDAGNNQVSFNGNGLGTNTYTNPSFTNPSHLLASLSGAPNCTGFVNTTLCMGWNANTTTLTSLTPISDLTPTAGGMTGKGYRRPSTTCVTDADFPAWLKGVVYLRASGWTNGATIAQYHDLITTACGL